MVGEGEKLLIGNLFGWQLKKPYLSLKSLTTKDINIFLPYDTFTWQMLHLEVTPSSVPALTSTTKHLKFFVVLAEACYHLLGLASTSIC